MDKFCSHVGRLTYCVTFVTGLIHLNMKFISVTKKYEMNILQQIC